MRKFRIQEVSENKFAIQEKWMFGWAHRGYAHSIWGDYPKYYYSLAEAQTALVRFAKEIDFKKKIHIKVTV